MQNVRRYADVIASIEGLVWLGLAWSISISMYQQSTEPTLAMLFVVGALLLFSWAHRPLRYLLMRYHIRKRRTDMWMHTLALPLLLTLLLALPLLLTLAALAILALLPLIALLAALCEALHLFAQFLNAG